MAHLGQQMPQAGDRQARFISQAGHGQAQPKGQVQVSQQTKQGQVPKHPRLHKFLRALWQLLSAAGAGVSALGLLRVLAPFLGFTIKINAASLTLAAILGAPGVVLLLLLRLCFW